MYTLLVVTHVLVSVGLIGLVLIQHGKGADAGAAFGSGASGTVFGSRGSANFLSRMTAWLAGAFFVISLALAYIVHGQAVSSGSVIQDAPAAAVTPAVPTPATSGGLSPTPTKVEPQVPVAGSPKAGSGDNAAVPEATKPKVPE